jgi:hypothetical protein
MMVRRKRQFIGFGFDPGESAHHFAVIIPEREKDPVTVEERFEWNDELKRRLPWPHFAVAAERKVGDERKRQDAPGAPGSKRLKGKTGGTATIGQ